jgi:hypothetical protein
VLALSISQRDELLQVLVDCLTGCASSVPFCCSSRSGEHARGSADGARKSRPRPGNGKGAAAEDPPQAAFGGEGEACGTLAILAEMLHTQRTRKTHRPHREGLARSPRDRRFGCRRSNLRSLRSPQTALPARV